MNGLRALVEAAVAFTQRKPGDIESSIRLTHRVEDWLALSQQDRDAALADMSRLVDVDHEDDGSWSVSIPWMPGHVGAGETLEAAIEAAVDAAEAWTSAYRDRISVAPAPLTVEALAEVIHKVRDTVPQYRGETPAHEPRCEPLAAAILAASPVAPAPLTEEALATALLAADLADPGLLQAHSQAEAEAVAKGILAAFPASPAAPTGMSYDSDQNEVCQHDYETPWPCPIHAPTSDAMQRLFDLLPGTLGDDREIEAAISAVYHEGIAVGRAAPTSEQDRLAAIGEAVERARREGWEVLLRGRNAGHEMRVGLDVWMADRPDAALADRGQEERTDG